MVVSHAANIAYALLFASLCALMTFLVLWGYRWRVSGIRGWWTLWFQVLGNGLLALHFLLLGRRPAGPESPAGPSPLVEGTFWYGVASLVCWGTISAGLWLRARRTGRRHP